MLLLNEIPMLPSPLAVSSPDMPQGCEKSISFPSVLLLGSKFCLFRWFGSTDLANQFS